MSSKLPAKSFGISIWPTPRSSYIRMRVMNSPGDARRLKAYQQAARPEEAHGWWLCVTASHLVRQHKAVVRHWICRRIRDAIYVELAALGFARNGTRLIKKDSLDGPNAQTPNTDSKTTVQIKHQAPKSGSRKGKANARSVDQCRGEGSAPEPLSRLYGLVQIMPNSSAYLTDIEQIREEARKAAKNIVFRCAQSRAPIVDKIKLSGTYGEPDFRVIWPRTGSRH